MNLTENDLIQRVKVIYVGKTVRQKGNFAKTRNFLRRMRFDKEIEVLKKYGEK